MIRSPIKRKHTMAYWLAWEEMQRYEMGLWTPWFGLGRSQSRAGQKLTGSSR